MPSLTVFLDSSVIISALISSTGGSHKIIQTAKSPAIKLITSRYVVAEIAKHFPGFKLAKNIHMFPNPNQEIINKFTSITPDPQDAPILAGAVTSAADILVSLDKKHILIPKVKKYLKPVKVYNPQQFWRYLDKTFPSP